jgi:hypothetical protein
MELEKLDAMIALLPHRSTGIEDIVKDIEKSAIGPQGTLRKPCGV